jgi:hypothetical protein
MPNIFTLQLFYYQKNIHLEYSYKEVNLALFEKDIAKIMAIDSTATILLCEIIERKVFKKEEQNSINQMIEILDRMAVNYFFVVDNTMNHQISFGDKVAYLPGCMLLAYYPVWINHHPNVTVWNPISNKGLMLLGKCEKIHRIGFLKKFYEKNSLDSIEWAANFTNQYDLIKEKFFTDYSDEEFKIFSDTCNRTLDIPINHPSYPKNSNESFQHLGFPYDHTLYCKTAFSVILESEYYSDPEGMPWISEKTWRAIANKHPFIMVGSTDNIPVLKNMGFKTFEEYLSIEDYYSLLTVTQDIHTSLDAIVTNTIEFSNLLGTLSPDLKHKITEDVNHNYELFESIMKEAVDTFLATTNFEISTIKAIIDHHNCDWAV